MSDVVSLQKFRREQRAKQGKQATLCGNGHHSWEVVTENRFDVKQGKLVTQYRCKRCGASKTSAH